MENLYDNVKETKNKRKKANFMKRLFFLWMWPVICLGNRRDLNENDLIPPRKKFDSQKLGEKLEKAWFNEVESATSEGIKPSLLRAYVKAFIWSYLPSGIILFMIMLLKAIQPILLARLLSFWSIGSTTTREEAFNNALAIIIITLACVFMQHHATFLNQLFGMKIRIASCSVMFRKVLRMSNGALSQTAAGKIVNLLSNDVNRFDVVFVFFHYIWLLPIQLALITYFAYNQAGTASFIGIGAIVLTTIPIQAILSKTMSKLRNLTAVRTDKRINKMSEIISGIQVIKMYAWEKPFENLVNVARKNELSGIMKASFLRNCFVSFLLFTERAALFIAVLAYSVMGNQVTASVVYPLTQFFALLQLNLAVNFPMALASAAEVIISIRRIEEVLVMSERIDLAAMEYFITPDVENKNLFKHRASNPVKVFRHSNLSNTSSGIVNRGFISTERFQHQDVPDSGPKIEINNVTASWTVDGPTTLKNISLRIKEGKLVAVIGAVGSGKSSILQLLLNELPALMGTVTVNGIVSYASQEPWLFPNTVRENILFGQTYDSHKYKKVCKVCALEKDFEQFPYGDQTLVGERGVSLSGGQRARINLARSVYREADVYLLDDPLSAVDANVGKRLFNECISLYLARKTRILVTHQVHHLQTADLIVVMNEGSIENMGTYNELASKSSDFNLLINALSEDKNEPERVAARKASIFSISSSEGGGEATKAQEMEPEERATGQLKLAVIGNYWKATNTWCGVAGTVLLFAFAQFAATFIDFWISYWTNEVSTYEDSMGIPIEEMNYSLQTQIGHLTNAEYLIVMGVAVGLCVVLTISRTFFYIKMCVRASQNLHNEMFGHMLKALMRFFDTNPSGRILNRFSKDIGTVDELLPRSVMETSQIFGGFLSILALNAVALYWTLGPTAVIVCVFIVFMLIYLNAAQAIKRLEGTTRSPVFSIIASALNGISTIRASNAQSRLVEMFDTAQDQHTAAWYGYLGGGATFGLTLDFVCVLYLASVMILFLFMDLDNIFVGNVGLAVTQSILLTNYLQYGARYTVELLGHMTSVERVLEYTKLETEKNLNIGKKEPDDWPRKGEITFKNVTLYYGPDTDPVLSNLNITIKSGSKVGIVGRTGAGKSSLIAALFRFAYQINGVISIDGIDTDDVSKQLLRSKISIIPQEPVLFSATVRYNLDPFDMYSDDEIWKALELVELKEAIPALDFKVSEGGSNFSVGQRQLVCLARAVLRSNKILIMDEATANVDPQTDAFIQKTIRTQFKDCTVLTIAHRLNTIMDSDMVIVMDTGEVAEYDHPHLLLENEHSKFTFMVKETGASMFGQLRNIAREAFFKSSLIDAKNDT